MRFPFSLLWAAAPGLLTACSGLGPEGSIPALYFNASPPYRLVDHARDSHRMVIVLDGEHSPGIERATVFVGTQAVEATRAPYFNVQGVLNFGAQLDRCAGIPQGEDVPVRYEMYDAQGTVVQQRQISVFFDTCP